MYVDQNCKVTFCDSLQY